MSSPTTTAARARASFMSLTAVYLGLCVPAAAYRSPAFIPTSRACLLRASPWATRTRSSTSHCRPRPSRPPMMMAQEEFNEAEIVDHLEHDFKADLALLATKFGTMIESVIDIEEVHISEIDGDHMQLDVVYCDRGQQTCVAVAVPITFPRHCDNENNVIDAIRELEEMEDVDVSGEIKLSKKKISAEMMETIARICVVMNRDFQDELVSFVRAFGGEYADRPTGQCEMASLTPDGFLVRAALFPDNPVRVVFPMECICAHDFQRQILEVSKQAMMIV